MNTATQPAAAAGADDNVIDGAITEVKAADPALAVLNPTQYAVEVFQPFEDRLATLRRVAGRAKYDITTKEGMTKAKELRAAAVKIRTEADKAKTAAKRPIDESGKLILAHYKKVEEAAKAEEAKHDSAITAEEARIAAEKQRKLDEERERVAKLEAKVDALRLLPQTLAGSNSDQLRDAIDQWANTSLTKAEYQEYFEEGIIALEASVVELRRMLDAALQAEEAARQAERDRQELERLRAEQAQREQEAAERQRLADEAAFEQQQRMAQQQAELAKQQQIMQDLQALQARGLVDGTARELDEALQAVRAVKADVETFGMMVSMAQMAKDSAINMLTQKLQLRVDADHAQALADDVLYVAHVEALDEDAERVAIAAQAARTAAATAEATAAPAEVVEATASYVDQDETLAMDDPLRQRGVFRRPAAPVLRPTDAEIVDALTAYFGQPRGTIAAWLIGMDLEDLRAIAAE